MTVQRFIELLEFMPKDMQVRFCEDSNKRFQDYELSGKLGFMKDYEFDFDCLVFYLDELKKPY